MGHQYGEVSEWFNLTLNQGVPGSSPGWVTREHGEVSEWFKELVLKTSDA